MIVTILGATGFMGTNLAAALAKAGHCVRSFDQKFSSQAVIAAEHAGIALVEGDFFRRNDLDAVLEGCDVCFHLISTSVPVTSNANPAKDAQENIMGTLHMLDAAVQAGVRKIIFPSSGGAIYGNTHTPTVSENHPTVPRSSYGITKLTIENYLRLYHELYGLDYLALRIANPYGPFQRMESRQGIIGVFLGRILRGEPISIWGDGSVVRDYLFIDDLTRAFLTAMEVDTDEKVFNIGSGVGYSVKELVETLKQVTGKLPPVQYSPAREQEIPYSVLDITRAQKAMGWTPLKSLEEGLNETWLWLKGQA